MSATGAGSVTKIWDIPREILVKIILYFDAGERIVLAHSSKLFHSLIFEDEELLKELDFSKEGRLTTASDIEQYFADENTSKHIRKVNLRNVTCLDSGQLIETRINKALNLVDINIHGTKLKGIQEMGNFLEPLMHVRRLSIDWPNTVSTSIVATLQRPFSTLVYFSVKIYSASSFANLTTLLELCQELKELHIVQEDSNVPGYESAEYTVSNKVLRSLEVVEFYGGCASNFRNYVNSILPAPGDWTNFVLPSHLDSKGFYLEKNVQICCDLADCQVANTTPPVDGLHSGFYLHWKLLLEDIIRKVDRIKNREIICCISPPGQCVLKIEEAKQLLKNPRHPITYLYTSHNIDMECDAHLLAKAFPTLTELHLSNITRSKRSTGRVPHSLRIQGHSQTNNWLLSKFKEHLQKDLLYCSIRSGPSSSDPNVGNVYIDSSFQILVEDTPGVTDLTLDAEASWLACDEAWDLGALEQIQRWKRLESLRLLSVPIVHGDFLIGIGKECTRLKKLELYNLGSSDSCCYIKELMLMLSHCTNLTEFSMKADNVGQISGVILSLLKNSELRTVRLILTTLSEIETTANLVSSIRELIRSCSKLNTFMCIIDGISWACSEQLTNFLRGLRSELNRPSLQFQVVRKRGSKVNPDIDTVREDTHPPSFPYNLEDLSWP